MNYTISTAKRNLMIFSAAFLTVYSIYNAFFFYALKPGNIAPDSVMPLIRDLLFAIPHLYLLFVLFDYFRHQGWKILQYILLFTAIMEIVLKAFSTINHIGCFMSSNFYYSMAVGGFYAISIIMQAIFLLQLNRKEYPAVFSLQKYIVALILFQLIAFGTPLIFSSEEISSMLLGIRILSGLPYLFLVEFALKLKLKEDNLTADSAV